MRTLPREKTHDHLPPRRRYMEENGYDSKSEAEEEKPKAKNGAFKRFQMSDRELDDYVEADSRMACRHGHAKMTKLLVDAGARVDLTDFRALTARDLACQYHHDACVDIIDDRPDILPEVDDDYLYNLIPERAVELMSPTRGVAPFFWGTSDDRFVGPRTSSTTGCSRRSCTAARTRFRSSRNRSTGRGSGAATRSRTRTRRT